VRGAWGVGRGTAIGLLGVLFIPAGLAAQRRAPPAPVPFTTGATPAPLPTAHVPPLPDPTGWGVHVLAMARGPDGAIWVGTYGDGIFVLRPGQTAWENLRSDTTGHAISWNFVHAFAFQGRDVWYGTVGNGWGVSHDGGRTWNNWEFRQLGPRWQYVAPNGIVVRGDTVFIATADGIRWTANRGTSWSAITDTLPARGGLPSRYVLTIAAAREPGLWIATLHGLGQWSNGAYHPTIPAPVPLGGRVRDVFVINAPGAVVPAVLGSESCIGSQRPKRRQDPARWECMTLFTRTGNAAIRSLEGCDGVLCAGATSNGALWTGRLGLTLQPRTGTARSRDVYAVVTPEGRNPGDTIFGTACGLLGSQPASCLNPGDTTGVRAPMAPLHTWFARPIARTEQPYIDQTYRYGSTMGGNFQPHQGVEFNNPVGTPVTAIDAGTVVHAGPAEQGALTVVIRHDSMLTTPEGRFYIYSTYYHNSRLLVTVGQRVTRGQEISRVGNTGRATNDHLHLEVHASPADSTALIVDPDQRFPLYTRNPELWIEPLTGTGVVAGQVWDAQGQPVKQARVYGLVKPEPQETPFSFAETYGDRNHPDPSYHEHFAVGDVPPGEYVLGTTIDGRQVFRRVRVEAGKVTWVEFR
jgi:hypothetical protein